MMRMSQAANALKGELIGADEKFTAVSKDTRDLVDGSLYVAIKGERFDGHEFVGQASAAGAAGALVSERQSVQIPQICVNDTRLALGELAAYWRQLFNGKLVGVTGSNGKTTVKEMLRSILVHAVGADHVLSTTGNLNNDIGMPMTLLSLRQQHRFAVIEMGANHPGEIDYLTHIAKPHVAVITNAGPAHLEGFGSIEKVASSKAEIYTGLVDGGTAVINADDAYADFWKSICKQLGDDKHIITFSMRDESADVSADLTRTNGKTAIQMKTPLGNGVIQLAVPGRHNVMNALAAAAVAVALGVSLEDIIKPTMQPRSRCMQQWMCWLQVMAIHGWFSATWPSLGMIKRNCIVRQASRRVLWASGICSLPVTSRVMRWSRLAAMRNFSRTVSS